MRYLLDDAASADEADYWKGIVQVGDPIDPLATVITLSPAAGPLADRAIDYGRLSVTLAGDDPIDGGAVSVSQTRHHKEDSLPAVVRSSSLALPPLATEYGFVSSASWRYAADSPGLRVRFYGPIATQGTFGSSEIGVRVEASPVADFTSGVIDVTESFATSVVGTVELLRRDLKLTPVCSATYDTDLFYRVIRNQDSVVLPLGTSLLTDPSYFGILSGATQRDVESFAHYFRIASRGDVAGPNQSLQPDGQFTADDIIVFLNWYFSADPRGDVAGPNQSVGPDGQFTADDIIVFLGWYFAGPGDVIVPTCQPATAGRWGAGSGGDSAESAPASAPTSAPASAPSGQNQAQRIANMQAMIDAEPNPQRRALLQAALQLLQSAPTPTPTPTPAPAPAPGTDDR
jgi:hypothetical protein